MGKTKTKKSDGPIWALYIYELYGEHYLSFDGSCLMPIGAGLSRDYMEWFENYSNEEDTSRHRPGTLKYDGNMVEWAEVTRNPHCPPRARVDVTCVELTPELIEYLRS